jgi:hypothetical protein
MKNINSWACSLVLFGLFFAGFQAAPGPSLEGAWIVRSDTPFGKMEWNVTIMRSGDELKVVMIRTGRDNKNEGTGSIKGNALSWEISRETDMGTVVIRFKGKIDGDRMSGEVDMAEMMTSAWTAERKKD